MTRPPDCYVNKGGRIPRSIHVAIPPPRPPDRPDRYVNQALAATKHRPLSTEDLDLIRAIKDSYQTQQMGGRGDREAVTQIQINIQLGDRANP